MTVARGSFLERQNTPHAIRQLAAATWFYGRARAVRTVEVLLVVLVPCLLSIAAAFYHALDTTAAFAGFTLAIIDVAILYPLANRARRAGAQVQERFDVGVLGLPAMSSRLDDAPDTEAIDAAAKRILSRHDVRARYENWYAPEFASLAPPLDRLACQRTNSVWDCDLRSWFQWSLLALVVAVSTIIFGLDVYLQRTGQWLLVAFLFPLLPAYLWTIREIQDQLEARGDRRDLRRLVCRLWDGYLGQRVSVEDAVRGSEDVQGALFLSRATAPPVPQALYRALRPRFEALMNESASTLVNDVRMRRPEFIRQDN
jgi:hypothetical protein